MPPIHRIVLFSDVASPYSWLAFECLARYQSVWKEGVRVEFEPFYLGGVMAATGNKPPGTLAAKRSYMVQDLARSAALFDVPIRQPRDGKVIYKTLAAQRLLTAVKLHEPAYLVPLMRALWLRIWSKDLDIAGEEGLLEACSACGLSDAQARDLVSRAGEPQVKDELKKVTAKAVEWGSFGAPSIFVLLNGDTQRRSHFFGSDRFDQIAHLVGQPWYGPSPSSVPPGGRHQSKI